MKVFAERLIAAVRQRQNPVLVGLDPRWENLPAGLRVGERRDYAAVADAYRRFCCGVIDAVAALVPIVKPQAAFFEEIGPPGMAALADVIRHAREHGLLVIVDGKRNDIGSTATAYAGGTIVSAFTSHLRSTSPLKASRSVPPL